MTWWIARSRGERQRRDGGAAAQGEHEIRFAAASARKGWRDLVATMRNAMADTWDFLTATSQAITATNHPLEGQLPSSSAPGSLTSAGSTSPP